jgi:predicted nucleotidyltransferase
MKDPLKEIIKRIVEEANPDQIILFGSRAKGEDKRWSDYDICVLVKKGVNLKDLEKRLYLKLYGTKVAVDIIAEFTDRFEEVKQNRYLVYHEIEKYGEIVYEK